MAKPLKTLINSCIGLSCEQAIYMEDDTSDSKKTKEVVDASDQGNCPISGNLSDACCDGSFHMQTQTACSSTSVMPMGHQPNHTALSHDAPLHTMNSIPSVECTRNSNSRPAFVHPHSDICFKQCNDSSVYGTTHLSLVPPSRIQSCMGIGQSCDSSSSSEHADWCPESCRVKVQMEVECLPTTKVESASEKSLGNKKSLWSCFLPKKVKHKDRHGKETSRMLRLSSKGRSSKCLHVEHANAQVQCCSFPSCGNNEFDSPLRASTSDGNMHRSFADVPTHCQEIALKTECDLADGIEGLALVPLGEIRPRVYSTMDLHFYFQRNSPQQILHTMEMVHTQVNYIHCLVPDLLDITNCSFYWGKMDRYEAERLIENKPEGTFLLRDSAQEDYLFSVSFCRHERSLHARIEQSKSRFSFDPFEPGVYHSDTVCGLLEFYKDPSCCMFYDPVLTNPLPRTFPFPLQHLCRATICSRISYNGISQLCLPKTLKHYLKEYHYKQRVSVKRWD